MRYDLDMIKVNDILEELRYQGFRLTRVRLAVLTALEMAKSPLTAIDLIARLKKSGLTVNKTTIYRELEFLKSNDIVIELKLAKNIHHYELKDEHHHHLVCSNCERIEEVKTRHNLELLEKKIARQKKFAIVSHSLEFYGLCQACKN